MRTIYKYQLDITDAQFINASGFRPLYVDLQHGFPCLWAEVDTDRGLESERIYIVGTGNPVPLSDSIQYVGTFQQEEFVWHVYWDSKIFGD